MADADPPPMTRQDRGGAPDGGLEWTETGAPRSRRFGDIYFQPDDGLAESRAVYLEGCGLPLAWRGRRRFVVGELGFGAGLNIAALLELWRREGEPGGRLHIFSVEAFPMTAAEAARALSAFPEVRSEAEALTARWPGRRPGLHRVDLPEWRAVLDVAVMEVEAALSAWTGRADAWFLDGFSPAANPEMWSEAVMAGVAARSAPGARAATFTVAGAVRRALSAAGFQVDKAPGHGRKRERLEARLPGAAPVSDPPRVVVVGAGIAGASLAWALRAEGLAPTVVAGAPGASANPAALVTPRLDAGDGPAGRFHAQAHARAARLYRSMDDAVLAEGVIQLEARDRDAIRFDRVAASEQWEDGAAQRMSAEEAGLRLGERQSAGGLLLRDGLTVEPALVVGALLGEAPVVEGRAAAITRDENGLSLIDAAGKELARADVVVIAAGAGARELTGLPLRAVRGQVSHAPHAVSPPVAAAWGGYVAPARAGVVFGATHDRGDPAAEVRAEDHGRNLSTLAGLLPAFAAGLDVAGLTGSAGVRAAAADHMPVAGALGGGLFVLGGLGGRGFTLAPLLAEHVAALVAGSPSPLPADLAAAVDPRRPALEPPDASGVDPEEGDPR